MNDDANNYETNPIEDGASTVTPAGYCRICGRGLREDEVRLNDSVIYCEAHAPASAPQGQAPPPPSDSAWATGVVPDSGVSPGLAFLLGLIPGVGAIYNGQYAKGLVHVVIFGLIISIISSGGMEGLFVPLLIGWIFYMPFEAYHTAKKRQMGQTVDEFSSLVPLKNGTSSKVGPAILIGGGVFFLLINLDLIEMYKVVRFWPVLLILLGGWMLYSRRGNGEGVSE